MRKSIDSIADRFMTIVEMSNRLFFFCLFFSILFSNTYDLWLRRVENFTIKKFKKQVLELPITIPQMLPDIN